MKRVYRFCRYFLFLTIGFPLWSQSMDIGWHDGLTEPLLIHDRGLITGGILFDLTKEVSRRTGLGFRFINIPRKRLDAAMLDGTINIRNFSNPSWTPYQGRFDWSVRLFDSENLIMTKSGHRAVTKIDDLRGLSLGTLLGYVYPELESMFNTALILRQDVSDINQNLGKLNLGRIDAMIADGKILQWMAKGTAGRYEIHPLRLSVFPVKWALSPSLAQSHPEILRALESMVKEGFVEQVLSRYR